MRDYQYKTHQWLQGKTWESSTPLGPGDVILTRTPGGVGFRRSPQVFLSSGDRVEVHIAGVGALINDVAAESPTA